MKGLISSAQTPTARLSAKTTAMMMRATLVPRKRPRLTAMVRMPIASAIHAAVP